MFSFYCEYRTVIFNIVISNILCVSLEKPHYTEKYKFILHDVQLLYTITSIFHIINADNEHR